MVPNLIVTINGLPKSGKTHLALTFPDPIVVFSFDIGLDRVLRHFEGKKISVKTYDIPIQDTTRPQPYAGKFWKQFIEDFKTACANKETKTIVLDTGTAIYELARHARAEELSVANLMPFQYGEVYARMSALIMQPRVLGINLALTHHLREKYIDDKNTGVLEMDGYKRVEGLVDVVLRTERKQVMKTVEEKGRQVNKMVNSIVTTITNCGYDYKIDGTELINTTYDELVVALGL